MAAGAGRFIGACCCCSILWRNPAAGPVSGGDTAAGGVLKDGATGAVVMLAGASKRRICLVPSVAGGATIPLVMGPSAGGAKRGCGCPEFSLLNLWRMVPGVGLMPVVAVAGGPSTAGIGAGAGAGVIGGAKFG